MENTVPVPRRIIRISRAALIVGIVIIIIAAFLIMKVLSRGSMMTMGNIGNSISGARYGMMEGRSNMMANDLPRINFSDDYYQGGTPDITDTREFLKTSYSAQIQTRDVEDVTRDVKNAVRDVEGRVDNFSSSEKNGYISFVIPKDNLDQFRDEIESLTHEKLYTENISSQNLLNQKQNIEQEAATITGSLAQLEKNKKDADAQHAARISSIQSELISVQAQLVTTRQRISDTNSSSERAQLSAQESVLVQREATLKYNRDQENKTYASNNQIMQSRIDQAKKDLEGNKKQDVAFGNNIETVNGSINVNWISLWQMAKLFSPIHPTIIVIALILALWYFLNRKQYLPKIEIV